MKDNKTDDKAKQASGERKTLSFRPPASLVDLVRELPKNENEKANLAIAEVREILVRVAQAGAVIFISDLAKKITVVKVEPTDPGLKQLVDLAADEEESDSGVDLRCLVLNRTAGSVSRWYLDFSSEPSEKEIAATRKRWAKAVTEVHEHFAPAGESVSEDEADVPDAA